MTKLLCLGVCLLALQGCATPTPRLAPPPGSAPKPVALPAIERFTLANGLQVTLIPYGQVPKLSLSLSVRTGNLDEGSDIGLADLVGDLMREGADGRDAAALSAAAADMGGDLGISVGAETTRLDLDALSDFAVPALALLADITLRPDFPEKELERLKTDSLRGLAVARSRPQSQAGEAFARAYYGPHRFGTTFPTEKQIETTTIADIHRFYADNFGAQRARLYISGQFDAAALKAAITRQFGDWARGPAPRLDPPQPQRTPRFTFIERPGAVQSTLVLGGAVPAPGTPDDVALDLTNTLLGGAFSSRITQNIREAKGYAYSPRATVSIRYQDAVWTQRADVTAAHTGDALREILSEIKRLRQEAPTADELEGFKSYAIGTWTLAHASRDGLIDALSYLDHHGLPLDHLTTYVPRVQALTPTDIQAVAKTHLDPDQMILVVVGDSATRRAVEAAWSPKP